MSRIIDDFIMCRKHPGGYGIYKGDDDAVELAHSIGKNQMRRYRREGVIPESWFEYLKRKKIIPDDADVPTMRNERLGKNLSDFFSRIEFKDRKSADSAEYLLKLHLKDRIPVLAKSFGSSEHMWKFNPRR